MRRRAPLTARLAVAGALLVSAAGCATVGSPLPQVGVPLVVATTQAPAAASAPAADCGDPSVSRRPPAVMPRPGAMPAGSAMARILERGYLVAGVKPDSPPFDLLDPNTGEFQGIDVDLVKEVAKAIFGPDGVDTHVRFRSLTNAERVPVLVANEVDIVAAVMTATCDRRTQVDFSVPYYTSQARVLVLKDSPYESMADLGGRKVCATAGSTAVERIRDAPSHPALVLKSTNGECLIALQQGEVDAVSTIDSILIGMAHQDPQTRIAGPSMGEEGAAIAVSLVSPELTSFVNGVLAEIERNGVWHSIIDHYLGPLDPPPVPPRARYSD